MIGKKLVLCVPFIMLSLGGCSGNKDLFAPVESPEIANKISVSEVWSASLGGSDKYFSSLAPAVTGANIYAASRNGDVCAINAQTGSKQWNTDLGSEEENDDRRSARLSGGVTAFASKVAVGSENGYIYVLDSATGKLLWKQYLENEIVTSPAFSLNGSRLFVLDSMGRLFCFDVYNGSRIWVSGDSSNKLRLRVQSKPVIVGDSYIFVGQASGKVQIISQENGAVVSEITVGSKSGSNELERVADVASTPLVLGESMYTTAYNSGFMNISLSSGTLLTKLGYRSSKDLAFDSNVFVITEDNGHISCISRADNHEIWTNSQLTYRNVTAPTIYGNYVVVGDLEGYVYFLNLADGRIVAKLDTDETPIYTAPKVVGSDVLIQTSGGDLECLRYDPSGQARSKLMAQTQELAAAGAGLDFGNPGGIYGVHGLTAEQLQQRRAEANRIVSQIEAHERAQAAQEREYRRQKAEYERRKAEYEAAVKKAEAERRAEVSGFGIVPGVKSDSTNKVEEDTAAKEETSLPTEEQKKEKASGFGL